MYVKFPSYTLMYIKCISKSHVIGELLTKTMGWGISACRKYKIRTPMHYWCECKNDITTVGNNAKFPQKIKNR